MAMWRILQLADSAFPTGGFAHSGGLEAAIQAGLVRDATDVARFIDEAILAAAHGALPAVGAAWDADDAATLVALDGVVAATLWSHVAARASRAQGRSLIDVAARAFRVSVLAELRTRVIADDQAGHLAVMFGAVTRALDISREQALATFLHLAVRALLSAAVRLGALGPTEAQTLHAQLDPSLDAALVLGRSLGVDDIAQTSPITELVQAGHDRLYSRLFQT